MPQVFLLTGATTFANPGNWDQANNKVECLGSAARGGNCFISAALQVEEDLSPEPRTLRQAGGGGGGGAYGYANNLNPTFPVTVFVPARNLQGYSNGPTSMTTGTIWNGYTSVAGNVWAACGTIPQGMVQGYGGTYSYPNGNRGGDGSAGNASSAVNMQGGGGGGAGGPHGVGSNGQLGATTGILNGWGGNADGNTVNGGQGVGIAGSSGTTWDATHGCGSGGSGGRATTFGGVGGSYGGGGGGQGTESTQGGYGDGSDGLIIITYVPLIPVAQILVLI